MVQWYVLWEDWRGTEHTCCDESRQTSYLYTSLSVLFLSCQLDCSFKTADLIPPTRIPRLSKIIQGPFSEGVRDFYAEDVVSCASDAYHGHLTVVKRDGGLSLIVDVLWLLQLLDAHGRYIWTSWLLRILAHLFVYCMLSQQSRSVATMQRVRASSDFCMMALLKSQTKMLKFWFWLTFLRRVMRRKLLMQWDPGVILLNPYCS